MVFRQALWILGDEAAAEDAAGLGSPLGTFKSRLSRARQQLQKWLL